MFSDEFVIDLPIHTFYIHLNVLTAFSFLLMCFGKQILMDLNLGDLVGQPYALHKHYSVS